MTQTTELLTAGVEILHLDKTGYGPNGSMTRRAWREACLTNLLAGKEQFEAWQKQVLAEHKSAESALFDLCVNGVKEDFGLIYSGNSCTLDFLAHQFDHVVSASEFKFLLPCNFCYVTFDNSVRLRKAVFKQEAIFHRARFIFIAEFCGASFEDDAWFTNSAFNFYSGFNNVNFRQDAWFKSSTFSMYAKFGKTKFNGDSLFQSARFEKESDFENAVFEKVGHFEKARFTTLPPNFKGVKTDVTRLEFSDDSYFSKSYRADDDIDAIVRNISTLKRLSDEHGQVDQALNFNAMELRAKRLLSDAGWGFKAVTGLYEVVSDCGRSFTRPLWFLLGLATYTSALALSFAVITSPASCQDQAKLYWPDWQRIHTCLIEKSKPSKPDSQVPLSGYRAAMEYTMYRGAGVLDFADTGKNTDSIAFRLFGQSVEPWQMRLWGAFKAIASTALLFLAALGLRNKYRIK